MTIQYKKVTLIVGFDPEKDTHPSKMVWAKKGIDIKLSKVEDFKGAESVKSPVCSIKASDLSSGFKIKHPSKGIVTVKDVSLPPGMKLVRIVFVDGSNDELIIFKKASFEFEVAVSDPISKKKRPSRAKKPALKTGNIF